MVEKIKIDAKYTYTFDEGRVSLQRHGDPWLQDPPGAKAWIAAAEEILRLREELAALSGEQATIDQVQVRLRADRLQVGQTVMDSGREHSVVAVTDPYICGQEELIVLVLRRADRPESYPSAHTIPSDTEYELIETGD